MLTKAAVTETFPFNITSLFSVEREKEKTFRRFADYLGRGQEPGKIF